MRYNVSPRKNKTFYKFPMNKLCVAKNLQVLTENNSW